MAKTIDARSAWEKMGFAIVSHFFTRCPTLSDGAKLTYLALIEYWQQDSTCWPSLVKLEKHRGKNKRTIRRHLEELEGAGLITREMRESRTSIVHRHDLREAFEGEEWFEALDGDTSDRGGRSKMSGGGGQKCPPEEEQGKKKRSPVQKSAPARRKGKPGKPSKPSTDKPKSEPSEHTDFVRWLCEESYPAHHDGEPYPFAGGKDAAHVKDLLERYGLEELKEITVDAFSDPWIQERGFTLGVLLSCAQGIFSRRHRKKRGAQQFVTSGGHDIEALKQILQNCPKCMGAGTGCPNCRAAYRSEMESRRAARRSKK